MCNVRLGMPSASIYTKRAITELAHSRELATLQACSAVLALHACLLALELPRGSRIARCFAAITYNQSHAPPQIDYKAFDDIASAFSFGLILAGFPSFSQLIDYSAINAVCRKVGAYVMVDMTEISGLLAAGLIASPVEHSGIVISGT